MSDQIINLPEYFFGKGVAEVNIYYYQTCSSSKNNKVCFSQNLLCFMLEGQKQAVAGSSSVLVDHTQLLLLQCGNTLMTERTTKNNSYKSVLFLFSDDFLLDFIERNGINQNKVSTVDDRPYVFLKDSYTSNFENSLLLLKDELQTNKRLTQLKLEEVLFYLHQKNSAVFHNFIYAALSRNKNISITRVVHNLSNQHLTVEELAFLCSMSISTFKRKFMEIFQTTPKQYFLQQRMARAAFLLRQNKRPSEIYFDLGYENLSGFSNEFKKHFGMSPRTFTNKVDLLE